MTIPDELRQMCDCQEIQSQFNKNYGDLYINKNDNNNKIHFVFEFEQYILESKYADPVIFIPSIEQVLEWLKGINYREFIIYWRNGIYRISYYGKEYYCDKYHPSETLIETLLKTYMKYNYNKEWDGVQWI